MNIQEAKAAKAQLEHDIADLLDQFTAATGTTVTSVSIDSLPRFGESRDYIVKVEVQL